MVTEVSDQDPGTTQHREQIGPKLTNVAMETANSHMSSFRKENYLYMN